MAVFHTWGQCRNPKCTGSLRANSKSVYCNACTLRDIRYGHPQARRITQKSLQRPLAAIARLRKRNQAADWVAMEHNWRLLVDRCREIANSRDADLRHRRRAAWTIVQIADAVPAKEVVDLVAASYLIEAQNPHYFPSDRAFWSCLLHVLRRAGRADRAVTVGGRDHRAHVSYRRLHKTARDIASDLIVEHMAVLGTFIANAEMRHQQTQADRRSKLMATLTALV